jgi:hypothetical protein
MRPTVLHWFRHRQRSLSRLLLAAFCLAWLQVAALPCVMAAGAMATGAAPDVMDAAAMPEGMTMAAGEHCVYCPPEAVAGVGTDVAGACSYPHDPQVDSRLSLAAALLAPPPGALLVVAADGATRLTGAACIRPAPPAPREPLNVSLCRFLE